MAAVVHPDVFPLRGQGSKTGHSPQRTVWLTALIVVVASIAIGVMMALSIILAGPLPQYDGPAWPRPIAEPSASAGLDL